MNILQHNINSMSLKDMDSTLLLFSLVSEVQQRGGDQAPVMEAARISAFMHQNDTRSSRKNLPRDTYITHPLRVALRLVRRMVFKTTEQLTNAVVTALLHDTVEDHAYDYCMFSPNAPEPVSESEARERGFYYAAGAFGQDASSALRRLSNPLMEETASRAEKNDLYLEHVREDITESDDVIAVLTKLSDLFDNGGSLHHNMSGGRLERMKTKYRPLPPLFRAAANRLHEQGLITTESRSAMLNMCDILEMRFEESVTE